MAKVDLGQTLNTLANVGVIAGIIFLALELNQNREMMRAQIRNELARGSIDVVSLSATSRDLADVLVRANEGATLTPTDYWMFVSRTEAVFRYFENVHYQYRQGLYDESEFSKHRDTMEFVMSDDPANVKYWCEARHLYSEAFANELNAMLPGGSC